MKCSSTPARVKESRAVQRGHTFFCYTVSAAAPAVNPDALVIAGAAGAGPEAARACVAALRIARWR